MNLQDYIFDENSIMYKNAEKTALKYNASFKSAWNKSGQCVRMQAGLYHFRPLNSDIIYEINFNEEMHRAYRWVVYDLSLNDYYANPMHFSTKREALEAIKDLTV